MYIKKLTKISAVVLAITLSLGQPTPAAAATTPSLLTAAPYGVLSSTFITNGGITAIVGDLGFTTPGGSGTSTVTGITHIPSPPQAGLDQGAALTALAAQPCNFTFGSPTDLSLMSQPLAPGVYCMGAATSIGTGGITLSGSGTYVFRIAGALTSVANAIVSLTGGANACDVFWTPTSATTLGANNTFLGTIIDDAGITVGNTTSVLGRLLAFGGTVTTDTNAITAPTCAAQATLHVIKSVVNTPSGLLAALPSQFNIYVKNGGVNVFGSPAAGVVSPGTSYTLNSGTYVVSEDPNAYTLTYGGACDSTGTVNLVAASDVTCTVINTDIPQPSSGGGSGGGSSRRVPLIGLLKVPTPLALPAGSGSVTYDYTVWNVGGQVALADVTLTDDKCSSISRISGDIDGDNKLDISETWKYRCTMTLSNTTTNTAVATGYSDDPDRQIAVDTAIATVVVGAPVNPPLIGIIKVPSRLVPFPYGGGDVTYTYTVRNPGIVPISNVVVTDDKCSPLSRISGDVNGNNLLDVPEIWMYTCRTNVAVSTMNTATAIGVANGFVAVDYAFATVLVNAPGLPNTGLPPEPWNNVMLAGILVLVIASVSAVVRKLKN